MSPQHLRYIQSIKTHLTKWLRRKSRRLLDEHKDAIITLAHLDLEPAQQILSPLYSPNPRGRKPFDPIVMLRSLLLMVLLKVESLASWASKLKNSKRLAVISGFDPENTPVAGTFYLFIDRLEDGAYKKRCQHWQKPSSLRKGKHRRNLNNEKEQRQLDSKRAVSEYDSVTEKLGRELLSKEDQKRQADLQQRLSDILIKCAVIPSKELGFIDPKDPLTICGDGSTLQTSASGNGTPTCKCRENGIYDCDCDRFYSDPTADWGYDSYHKCYYFGHRFYQHTISTNGVDLPLHVSIGPASETDFTLSLKDLDHFQKTLTENGLDWQIQHGVYDAGHDATGIYQYLHAKRITPVIPLNRRRGENPLPTGTAEKVTDDGVPICPGGLPMRRHCHDKNRHRIYYNCPVKRPTHKDGKFVYQTHQCECPLESLCDDVTKMGPVVYVKTEEDPRFYPAIRRDSAKYKQLSNLRSGVERSNSAKKHTYKLGRRVCRNDVHFLVRLHLVSILEHARVWARADCQKVDVEGESVLDFLTKTLEDNKIDN